MPRNVAQEKGRPQVVEVRTVDEPMAIAAIPTPAVVVYLDVLQANIAEMSRLAAEAGVKLRPHTKIHECPGIAKLHLAGGACGIEVGTIERAVCMAAAGIEDILIAHPVCGEHRLQTLRRLIERPGLKLTVMVDMLEQARPIAQIGKTLGKGIPVLLKLNTGGNRFGVRPGQPALLIAQQLCRLPGIILDGIYAHEAGGKPTAESQQRLAVDVATMVAGTARLFASAGIPLAHVSVGASPTLRATCALLREKQFPEITEIHPGHCTIGDMWHVKAGVNAREACAAAVLCSVMSTANQGYVVIDAGYKTFGADSLIQYRDMPDFFWDGMPSYGSVQGHPELWVGRLGAETACVYSREPGRSPEAWLRIGDRLEIVPNNATLAISMQERLYGIRQGAVEQVMPVGGRGRDASGRLE